MKIKVSVNLIANLSTISGVWPIKPLNPYAIAISHPKQIKFLCLACLKDFEADQNILKQIKFLCLSSLKDFEAEQIPLPD